jgi:hypothetical protein
MYGHEVGLIVLIMPPKPFQSARARFATGVRHVIFRVGFRFGELRLLRISEFPQQRYDPFRLVLLDGFDQPSSSQLEREEFLPFPCKRHKMGQFDF